MNKVRICVPIGCRSDEGLSAPIIKRLKEQDEFTVSTLQLDPQNFHWSYTLTELEIRKQRPDLLFVTGDRVEMCAAAAAAFHNKVKIAHYYAGVTNNPVTTFDDIDRHAITLWSSIQFCENVQAQWVVWDLKKAANLPVNSYDVGISHLDDMVVDESKVPEEPYILLLKNIAPLEHGFDIHLPEDILTIQIGGNPDGMINFISEDEGYVFYHNLPRPQFLGLLKNCQRFITNSSAAIYEAPYFLKPEQIVMVGDRNKNRPKGPFKTGASDRIVEVLKEYVAATRT